MPVVEFDLHFCSKFEVEFDFKLSCCFEEVLGLFDFYLCLFR